MTITIRVRPVVVRIKRAAQAILAGITIRVSTDKRVEWIIIKAIIDTVIIIIQITRIAGAVAVKIRPIVGRVVVGQWPKVIRSDRAVVAGVAVEVLADIGIQGG